MEAEDQRKNKYEQEQVRDDDESLRDIDNCEVLVFLVFHLAWITPITSK